MPTEEKKEGPVLRVAYPTGSEELRIIKSIIHLDSGFVGGKSNRVKPSV